MLIRPMLVSDIENIAYVERECLIYGLVSELMTKLFSEYITV